MDAQTYLRLAFLDIVAAVKINTAHVRYAFKLGYEKDLLTFYRFKAIRANGVFFNWKIEYKKYLSKVCCERTILESLKRLHKMGLVKLNGVHLRLLSYNKLKGLGIGKNRWVDYNVLEKKFALQNVLIEDLICRQRAMSIANHQDKKVSTEFYYIQSDVGLTPTNEHLLALPSIPTRVLCNLINRKQPITATRTFRKLGYSRKRRFRYTTECGEHLRGRCEFIDNNKFERLPSVISPMGIFLDRRKRDSLPVGNRDRNYDDCYCIG